MELKIENNELWFMMTIECKNNQECFKLMEEIQLLERKYSKHD